MPPSSTSDAGYLLVDAIIATTVVAGAILAFGRLIGDAAQLNAASRQTTMSAVLAAQKLEELRSQQRLDPAESNSERIDEGGNVLNIRDVTRATYVRQWTITAVPGRSLVRVTVLVAPSVRQPRIEDEEPGPGGAMLVFMRRAELP